MRPLDPRLLRQARAARSYVVLTTALGVVSAALVVVQAVAIASVLGPVVLATSPGGDGEVDGTSLARWLTVLACVVVGRAVVAWAQERFGRRAATLVVADLRRQVVAHAVALGPRPPAGTSPSDVATLATRGLGDLEPYLVRFLPQLLLTALVTPAAVLVVWGLDWVSAVVAVVTIPLVPFFMWLIGTMTAGTSERRLATVERLGSQVLDLVAGLPTLRAFGREIGPGARVRALGESSRRATMGTLRIAFLSGAVLELLTTLCVAVIAVGVGLRLVYGHIELVPAIAVLVLAPEIFLPLRRVGFEFHASTDGIAATERAFGVLGAPVPAPAVRPAPAATGGELVLDDVTVRAPGRDVDAPAHLSARVRLGTGRPGGGRVVALRGPSGAGKSTLVLLLLGLLRPDSGRILLQPPTGADDPVDLADVDAATWWDQVVWVPQRPAVGPGTVRDVVTDGRTVDPADLAAAAATTGLDAVLADLPAGWDTPVGLGGVGLSVGQRQRVALARALVGAADRPVVVLDEPTAHLDARGERCVLDTVRAWRDAGRTVVVVAHRASLLTLADQVVDVAAQEVARA
ncbi:ATP-binding cassette subfamily C protein CydD [Isoptericola jiangsuensis]|uniref:ATP-binding cassette subfamily C protein CydD n=1 Tax=Isoptericola jiangsuensis TaxID=548579 RepID=A0A2A9EZH5_9MICO|nr:thiol reductant ABC exporter subunit CydD [Isoptericola jiangsuensis]PFG43712.1 ATP-binding cassette subfamily C protein CydD [Isoptericola jiangsuensis]